MNPYEPPQTATPATTILLQEGLSEQQQHVYLGYKACSIAGKYLSWGILGECSFYGAIYLLQKHELIDVRYLYVLWLIPVYFLFVGWLLNRQGLLRLAQHSAAETSRERYRLCRFLSLTKLLIWIACLLSTGLVKGRVLFLAILCLWPIMELVTILLLQFRIVRELGKNISSSLKSATEFYLVLGISVVCLMLAGLLLHLSSELAILPYNMNDLQLIANCCLGIAFFLYSLELKVYHGVNLLCAQSFEQVDS